MNQLISLIVLICVFCGIGWLGFWICDRAGFPFPVRWIFGVIMLIALLYIIAGQFAGVPNYHFLR